MAGSQLFGPSLTLSLSSSRFIVATIPITLLLFTVGCHVCSRPREATRRYRHLPARLLAIVVLPRPPPVEVMDIHVLLTPPLPVPTTSGLAPPPPSLLSLPAELLACIFEYVVAPLALVECSDLITLLHTGISVAHKGACKTARRSISTPAWSAAGCALSLAYLSTATSLSPRTKKLCLCDILSFYPARPTKIAVVTTSSHQWSELLLAWSYWMTSRAAGPQTAPRAGFGPAWSPTIPDSPS